MSPQILTEQDVINACERALKLAPEAYPPTLPASPGLLGAPEWYPFEIEVWPIGEDIRQAFSRNRKLKHAITSAWNRWRLAQPLCRRSSPLALRHCRPDRSNN